MFIIVLKSYKYKLHSIKFFKQKKNNKNRNKIITKKMYCRKRHQCHLQILKVGTLYTACISIIQMIHHPSHIRPCSVRGLEGCDIVGGYVSHFPWFRGIVGVREYCRNQEVGKGCRVEGIRQSPRWPLDQYYPLNCVQSAMQVQQLLDLQISRSF